MTSVQRSSIVAVILCALGTLPSPAGAQPPAYLTQWGTRGSGNGQFDMQAQVESDGGATTAAASLWPSPIQIESPSANPASPSLLDGAALPNRFAIAVDQPLGDPDGGRALTLRVTPLRFSAAPYSTASRDYDRRERNHLVRLLGVAATLGGPTQADDFSRVSRPRRLTNHFTAELKMGLMGGIGADAGRERSHPFDRPFAVGLGLTADTYTTTFGRDLYTATLIAEAGRPFHLIGNVGYRQEEKFHGVRNQDLKLGAGICRCLFPTSRWPVGATLSGDELIRNHRGVIWQGNAGFDFTLNDEIHLSSSVTCSDHSDRYAEGRVRVIIGLGFTL